MVELLIVLAVVAIVAAVSVPAILFARERSRQSQCQARLMQLSVAVHAYHDDFNVFPAASVWRPGPLSSLALHATERIDIVTYDNWALTLLPYLGQQTLAQRWQKD